MKFFLPLITLLSLSAFAQTEFQTQPDVTNCQLKSINLILNSQAPNKCQLLKIDGPYQIQLCNSETGKLRGNDGTDRYLFKDEGFWIARQDMLDFTSKISTTEIVQIDILLSKFSISKIKTKQDGTILEKSTCYGLISTLL